MERISLGLRSRDIGCGLENCRLYITCSSCPQLELGSDRLNGCWQTPDECEDHRRMTAANDNLPHLPFARPDVLDTDNAATETVDHTQMRQLLTPAFSARRMQALRPRIGELVDTLLDQLADQTPPADLHEALSFPLPALVICELLGVPYADRDQFRAWSAGIVTFTDRQASTVALGQLVSYLRQLVARKRAHPGQDVISDLLAAHEGGHSEDDRIARLAAVLLLTHPDQRAGDAVLRNGVAANRDPTVFADPDRFDITRPSNSHLSFGYGPHFCVGASLARLELRAVFTALLRRFPTLELAVPVEELHLRDDLVTGGFTALPVTW
ncbi:MAG: cytochrome P450 [Pseudonocardiaceae bacterium]